MIEGEEFVRVTCSAPVNIAVIKYWGKRDEKLILPINSSISGTLHQDELCAKTTIEVNENFDKDRIWLNGKEESIENDRLVNVLEEFRRRAEKKYSRKRPLATEQSPNSSSKWNNIFRWKLHICSENNFPTAAGLASSAAGYSCLVYTLAQLFRIEGDISGIARLGSGSACRSVFGGFVQWVAGEEDDGSDSVAKQVVSEDYWPEMCILVLVVSDHRKPVSSTSGMERSVETSDLLRHRAAELVPKHMEAMTAAIKKKDFASFAEITMRDSNQMHACCLDTYPPIVYLNDTSHHIMRLMHAYNAAKGQPKVAYTFDAGPNACLYLLEESVSEVLAVVKHFYGPREGADGEFVRGRQITASHLSEKLLDQIHLDTRPGALKYVLSTSVGPGPRVLADQESLLGCDGQPKRTV